MQASELKEGSAANDPAVQSLIDFMVQRNILGSDAAERARAAVLRSGQPVDTVLSELGLVGETALAHAQAEFLDVPLFSRDQIPDSPIVLEGLSPDFLRRSGVLPLGEQDDKIIVATARPLETDPLRSIAFYLDKQVRIRVGSKSEIEAALKSLYGDGTPPPPDQSGTSAEASDNDIERLRDVAREAPIIMLVTRIISEAAERNASDIHLEPTAGALRVRYRIDGALRTTEMLGRGVIAGVTTRIKILAHLNIAERRLPQDGRMQLAIRGRDIDLRVSTVPTLHGESIVLRILDRGTIRLDFAALGFEPPQQKAIRELIGASDGIVLVTGPTGSGKTTSLYAALLELNREETKIFTVEDPIEYQLPGINQIQVKPGIDLGFVDCLRAILRQDPDIIMIGEIRDSETARIAIQAALTGHLVLSTLHTNSAAASVTRLLDMGIEGYLLAATLRGVIAQRLVRRVCRSCADRGTQDGDLEIVQRKSEECDPFCAICQGTRYSGRTTIAEVLPIDRALRELISRGASEAALEEQALSSGMVSLHRSGMAKVSAGETTLDEILRVARASS